MSNSPGLVDTNGVPVIQPQWPLTEKVVCHSTTRRGGCSHSPFDSLNLGLHVSDNEQRVRDNRRVMSAALSLPAEPVWLNQTHGVSVCDGAKPEASASYDAAWTNQRNTVLCIMTADCLPVVLATADGSEIGAAHAGWRGLADGILENTVARFETSKRELVAWLGPAIGPEQFEVGDDVRDQFLGSCDSSTIAKVEAAFVRSAIPGKWYADLYQLARIALNAVDVTAIYGGDYCTYGNEELFFSYRRDGARSGRMATLVWIP